MRKTRVFIILLAAISLLLTYCLVGCGKEQEQDRGGSSDAVHTIKDMAGREVEVPTKIDKVFSTNPPGAIL